MREDEEFLEHIGHLWIKLGKEYLNETVSSVWHNNEREPKHYTENQEKLHTIQKILEELFSVIKQEKFLEIFPKHYGELLDRINILQNNIRSILKEVREILFMYAHEHSPRTQQGLHDKMQPQNINLKLENLCGALESFLNQESATEQPPANPQQEGFFNSKAVRLGKKALAYAGLAAAGAGIIQGSRPEGVITRQLNPPAIVQQQEQWRPGVYLRIKETTNLAEAQSLAMNDRFEYITQEQTFTVFYKHPFISALDALPHIPRLQNTTTEEILPVRIEAGEKCTTLDTSIKQIADALIHVTEWDFSKFKFYKEMFEAVERNPIKGLENKKNLHVALLFAMTQVESSNDPNATSPVGAKGLLQLMPITYIDTWKQSSHPLKRGRCRMETITNPEMNLDAGAKYLQWLVERKLKGAELVTDGVINEEILYALLRIYNSGPSLLYLIEKNGMYSVKYNRTLSREGERYPNRITEELKKVALTAYVS